MQTVQKSIPVFPLAVKGYQKELLALMKSNAPPTKETWYSIEDLMNSACAYQSKVPFDCMEGVTELIRVFIDQYNQEIPQGEGADITVGIAQALEKITNKDHFCKQALKNLSKPPETWSQLYAQHMGIGDNATLSLDHIARMTGIGGIEAQKMINTIQAGNAYTPPKSWKHPKQEELKKLKAKLLQRFRAACSAWENFKLDLESFEDEIENDIFAPGTDTAEDILLGNPNISPAELSQIKGISYDEANQAIEDFKRATAAQSSNPLDEIDDFEVEEDFETVRQINEPIKIEQEEESDLEEELFSDNPTELETKEPSEPEKPTRRKQARKTTRKK